MTSLDIGALDRAGEAEFRASVAPLFEGAPRFLGRLAAARPFGTWAALFERARSIAHDMPEAEQLELIDAHPRLGAAPATVSAMSFREQGYEPSHAAAPPGPGARDPSGTGPDTSSALAPDPDRVAGELERLNAAYEARFGFRYCVFVAGRARAALLPEMESSLWEDRDMELHRALDAVVDIAIARLDVLLADSTEAAPS